MHDFNWFDFLLYAILLASIVAGFRAGFARVVVGLAATVVGLLAGFWCYRIAAAYFVPGVTHNQDVANLLGFFSIFFVVLLIGAIIAIILSRVFSWIGLSWLDHTLGGLAGIARGLLVIVVLSDVLVAFVPPPPPEFLSRSQVLPYTNQFGGWLIEVAPRELKDAFEREMDKIKMFAPLHRNQQQPQPAERDI